MICKYAFSFQGSYSFEFESNDKRTQLLYLGGARIKIIYIPRYRFSSGHSPGYTLGARDFSCAVSGLCHVRGFGLPPAPKIPEDSSKISATRQKKSLVPRVSWINSKRITPRTSLVYNIMKAMVSVFFLF